MKKIRLFLVASCLLIAGVGIAAAKAKPTNVTLYYLNGTTCTSESIPDPNCTTGGSGCKDASNRQLYNDDQCSNILKTK